ncbi:MAG: hypothetical protein FWE10_08685, partial [Rikenellaceae bacterium]|nr:hypothetical protein [Rikenellaceae bacterium]
MKVKDCIKIFAIAFAVTSCGWDTADDCVPKKGGNVEGYSFTIAASHEGGDDATRAFFNTTNGIYYWTVGDAVGLFATNTGTNTLVFNNLRMVGDNTTMVTSTTFTGTVTQPQIDAMPSTGSYDYYTYFPYTASPGGTFPNIQFTIPSAITVQPNIFNPLYAPMVAQAKTNQSPILYLDGSQNDPSIVFLNFEYRHLLSYAAIELDVNLQAEQVTSITIINNNGTAIWGVYGHNMSTGVSSGYSSGGNTLTVNIAGGLTVGNGNIIYIPMPPVNMTGQTFNIQFNTASANNRYLARNIPGANFLRGQIHKLDISNNAEYRTPTSFTITKAGYYFIEAWGGDGGSGYSYPGISGGAGGVSQRVAGLYYLSVGDMIYLHVGMVGTSGTTTGRGGTRPAGGTNGGSNGTGGLGGLGGNPGGNPGGAGGAGGAGTFFYVGTTAAFPANLRLVSGGGGGGGGATNSTLDAGGTSNPGGNGGAGGTANNNGANGIPAGGASSGGGGAPTPVPANG